VPPAGQSTGSCAGIGVDQVIPSALVDNPIMGSFSGAIAPFQPYQTAKNLPARLRVIQESK
jgi:hypothetical protein